MEKRGDQRKSTTEIASFTLRADVDVHDDGTDAGTIYRECVATAAGQPGFRSWSSGVYVETPRRLQMFIDWDEYASHEAFRRSAGYSAFVAQFAHIIDTDEPDTSMMHVDFDSLTELKSALEAPVTEVLTLVFDTEPPEKYLKDVQEYARLVRRDERGPVLGFAYGLTYEEIDLSGKHGRAYVVVVGWPSLDAHAAFQESSSYKQNIGLLKKDEVEMESHHVGFVRMAP